MDALPPDLLETLAPRPAVAASCAALPAQPLRRYISHYWLCRDTRRATHAILPDGAVELVLTLGRAAQFGVYGTTTTRVDLALEPGAHHLGVRFHPGQSRHFVDLPTRELVDGGAPLEDASRLRLPGMAEAFATGDPFAQLDTLLLRHIERHPPQWFAVDDALPLLAAGGLGIAELAYASGVGLRQFERRVVEAVGVSPKLFAAITRFQRASAWLVHTPLPLADIAATCGYTDQSHLTRAFVRFADRTPAVARRDVAFVQDPTRAPRETAAFFNDAMRCAR